MAGWKQSFSGHSMFDSVCLGLTCAAPTMLTPAWPILSLVLVTIYNDRSCGVVRKRFVSAQASWVRSPRSRQATLQTAPPLVLPPSASPQRSCPRWRRGASMGVVLVSSYQQGTRRAAPLALPCSPASCSAPRMSYCSCVRRTRLVASYLLPTPSSGRSCAENLLSARQTKDK